MIGMGSAPVAFAGLGFSEDCYRLVDSQANSVDIPTECPTREWAGDINVFSETASFYTDTRKFSHKYLGDFIRGSSMKK